MLTLITYQFQIRDMLVKFLLKRCGRKQLKGHNPLLYSLFFWVFCQPSTNTSTKSTVETANSEDYSKLIRAAIVEASDGIMLTSSQVIGVDTIKQEESKAMPVVGVASLIAGALSMA